MFNRKQIETIKRQVACGAKGHGNMKYKGIVGYDWGVTNHHLNDYCFKCKKCGLEISYEWHELEPKEQQALITLGIVEDK